MIKVELITYDNYADMQNDLNESLERLQNKMGYDIVDIKLSSTTDGYSALIIFKV